MSPPLNPFIVYTHSPIKCFPVLTPQTLMLLIFISDMIETITIRTALFINYHEKCLQKQL